MILKKDIIRSKIQLHSWIIGLIKKFTSELTTDLIAFTRNSKILNVEEIEAIKKVYIEKIDHQLDSKLNDEFASLLNRIDDNDDEHQKISFELKGYKITFNQIQSHYIKQIMKKLPYIDSNRFLSKCAIIKIRCGNKSFTRRLKFYFENKLKWVPSLNFD